MCCPRARVRQYRTKYSQCTFPFAAPIFLHIVYFFACYSHSHFCPCLWPISFVQTPNSCTTLRRALNINGNRAWGVVTYLDTSNKTIKFGVLNNSIQFRFQGKKRLVGWLGILFCFGGGWGFFVCFFWVWGF